MTNILNMKGHTVMGWHPKDCTCLPCEVNRLRDNCIVGEEYNKLVRAHNALADRLDDLEKAYSLKAKPKRKWRPW